MADRRPAGTARPTPPSLPPNVAYDPSLQHPRCVFQLLKQQYSRYTPEMVERITGIPKDQFLKAADLFTSVRTNGDMKKVASIIYAVGWTQHTNGTQIIRTAAMLQLLLGNVGRAGGGVNALRGHSNIQGATDLAGVFDILPGYLKMPSPDDADFATYVKRITPATSKPSEWDSFNYWSNTPKFAVSFLKAMYGAAATKENGWAFHYLPKIDRNYSWTQIWDDMYGGSIKGLLSFGMNGVQIGPNSRKNIDALKKAEWLVVGELYPDETSEFWRAPGTTPEEMKNIQTTVYRLPCAGFAEKDGTFVNSARWLQWKNAALPPPGDARLDQDILAQIFLRVRELYQREGGTFPDPILNLRWPYIQPKNPALSELAREINGQALADITDATGQSIRAGEQVPGFGWLKDDGTTLCGNWLYSGSWTEAGNQMARRSTDDPSGLGVYPNWAWSWPANRRVQYNRASCDLSGKPWDPDRPQVWWNEATGRWVGNDVPDFKTDSKPSDHMGPFIMNPEGVGRLFGPLAAFAEGPFPEHYEPIESPIAQPSSPVAVEQPGRPQDADAARQVWRCRRRVQHRLHDLPADGALPLLDEEQPDERAARAGAVRRDSRGARQRHGPQGRRARESLERAGHLRRQGDGDAADQADDDRREEDLPDWDPDPLGIPRHRGRRGTDVARLGQSPLSDGDRPERLYPGIQGLPREAGKGIGDAQRNPADQGHLRPSGQHPRTRRAA